MPERTMRRYGTALAAVFVLVVGVTACGDDDTSDDLPPPASPQPEAEPTDTRDLSPEDAEAAEEILAAFDDYMNAYIELSTEGVPGGTDETAKRLEDVPVDAEAWTDLLYELLNPNYEAGLATDGAITWEAAVEEIDWENTFPADPDDTIPEAYLRICFDETSWTTIDKETGEVVGGPGKRYLSQVVVTWQPEDPDRPEQEPGWEVTERTDGSEPC